MRVLIPQTDPLVQQEAVTELIKRLIGEKSKLFNVIIDPNMTTLGKDTFLVSIYACVFWVCIFFICKQY